MKFLNVSILFVFIFFGFLSCSSYRTYMESFDYFYDAVSVKNVTAGGIINDGEKWQIRIYGIIVNNSKYEFFKIRLVTKILNKDGFILGQKKYPEKEERPTVEPFVSKEFIVDIDVVKPYQLGSIVSIEITPYFVTEKGQTFTFILDD
ncbi:hypothetical protein ES703_65437 [subsurface metagenome]